MEGFEGERSDVSPRAAGVAAEAEDPFGSKERGPSFGSWANSPTPVH